MVFTPRPVFLFANLPLKIAKKQKLQSGDLVLYTSRHISPPAKDKHGCGQ
jgi:hypothetical protein